MEWMMQNVESALSGRRFHLVETMRWPDRRPNLPIVCLRFPLVICTVPHLLFARGCSVALCGCVLVYPVLLKKAPILRAVHLGTTAVHHLSPGSRHGTRLRHGPVLTMPRTASKISIT